MRVNPDFSCWFRHICRDFLHASLDPLKVIREFGLSISQLESCECGYFGFFPWIMYILMASRWVWILSRRIIACAFGILRNHCQIQWHVDFLLFSSKRFMVLAVTIGPLIHFYFCIWCKISFQLHSLVCRYPIFPTQFIEKCVPIILVLEYF